MDLLSFDCPRCSAAVNERFYGPCSTCRAHLAAGVQSEARVIDDVTYEPKMNVVPNQVATKE